jgi:hypothetical protein
MCDNYDVSFLPLNEKPNKVVFSCDPNKKFEMSSGEKITIGDITYKVNLSYNDSLRDKIILQFSIMDVKDIDKNDIIVEEGRVRNIKNYPTGTDTTSIDEYINLLKPDFLETLKWKPILNNFIIDGLNSATQGDGQEEGDGQEQEEQEDEEEAGGGKKKSKRIRKSKRKKSRKHRKFRKSRKSKRRY